MIEFIVQHPVQAAIILFVCFGVLSRFEIFIRRRYSNFQRIKSDGMVVTQKGSTVEIVDEQGTRIVVEGAKAGKIEVNGKTVRIK